MLTIDLAVFTDLWRIRGDKTAEFLANFVETAYRNKHTVRVFSPRDCSISFPILPHAENRIALNGFLPIRKILKGNSFRGIYIPTPNMPIGLSARLACRMLGLNYATNKHAPYPKYLREWIAGVEDPMPSDVPLAELSSNLYSIVTR